MGLPVVGTTSATQGVEGVDGRDFRVRDDPAGFAREVAARLRSPDEALALGRAARAFVEQHYDWEVVFRPLDDLLERCARAPAAPRGPSGDEPSRGSRRSHLR